MNTKINWDILGIVTSVTCAIHCAILPLLVSALPLFGINIIHNAIFEWGMIAIAFLVGLYALYHGYARHHHNLFPILIFSAGIILLILKQFFHSSENWFLLFAVPSIIVAHLYNYRLVHKSKYSGSRPSIATDQENVAGLQRV